MKTTKIKAFANRITVIGYCLLVIVLASCSDEDYLGGHVATDGMGTLMNVTSQISSQADPSLAWSAGDVIGIAAGYGQSDISARNREYVCQDNGSTFSQTTGYPLYVKGATDIVAYYPFVGSDGAEPTLTLDTRNQQNITDYLFAKVENVTPQNGGNVNLVFDYALARLNLAITVPAGETIRGYRLSGFAQQATVDPYTLDMTLDTPEDLVGTGSDIRDISLRLIPQTVDTESGVEARLVLIGTIRSYSIDMSSVVLTAGSVQQATVDVTSGTGSLEFVPGGSTWTDSGLGGSVSAN